MPTLLLRLEGPMQSWGIQSRFTVRDAGAEPSKSGVIGLLCAALGKPRDESPDDGDKWPKLAALSAMRFGVRIDRAGRLQRDYQTAGGTRGDAPYGVAKADGSKPQAVTSQRYYLADASFLAGFQSDDINLLTRLHEALSRPVWALYLGRKSYVPSTPVHLPEGLVDQPLLEALSTQPWIARTDREAGRATVGGTERRLLALLDAMPGTYGPQEGEVRMDVPISFAERRFATRVVVTEWIELGADRIRGDAG